MTYFHWLGKEAESVAPPPEIQPQEYRPPVDRDEIDVGGTVIVQPNE